MGKLNRIIGIDPDVEKSGVAILTLEPYSIKLKSMSFSEIVDFAYDSVADKDDMRFVVEGGWINHSHFHLSNATRAYMAARMGNDVGRNHETGRKIIEVLEHLGYDVVVQKPLKKIWGGKDGKITKQELVIMLSIKGYTLIQDFSIQRSPQRVCVWEKSPAYRL